MDSQSVKTTEESGLIKGYDGGKQVKGRKRHLLVDTLGLLLSVYVTPANTSDEVSQAYFSLAGVPTDDLSKFAWSKHTTKPENPVSKYTVGLQNLLNTLHSAVLSNSKGIDAAITEAQDQAKKTVLNQ